VGASLLAIAVGQLSPYELIYRYREQARSHKELFRLLIRINTWASE
jgi:hypothetical protein